MENPDAFRRSSVLPTRALSESNSNVNISFSHLRIIFDDPRRLSSSRLKRVATVTVFDWLFYGLRDRAQQEPESRLELEGPQASLSCVTEAGLSVTGQPQCHDWQSQQCTESA